MNRYKLVIAYDGTNFSGSQVQANGRTVQGELERALGRFLNRRTRVTMAGRTDAGVHATGQVAAFQTSKKRDPGRTRIALNSLLPEDVRVVSVQRADPRFHPQFAARKKRYRYRLAVGYRSPLTRHHQALTFARLDLPAMRRAARSFVGRHDFAAFSATGSPRKRTVRTLSRLSVLKEPEGFEFVVEGDGFLYKMVRRLTGALIEVGRGRMTSGDIVALLNRKKNSSLFPGPSGAGTLPRPAGISNRGGHSSRLKIPTAPPEGLVLERVWYS